MSRIWDTAAVKLAAFHPKALTVIRSFSKDMRREIGKVVFDLQAGVKLYNAFAIDAGNGDRCPRIAPQGSVGNLSCLLLHQAGELSFDLSRFYEEIAENAPARDFFSTRKTEGDAR